MAVPVDPQLPAATQLLGPRGAEPLEAALRSVGRTLVDARLKQVQYRPGRRLTASFDARVRWPTGGVREEILVATARTDGPPAGSLVVEREALRIGVWRFPNDPLLPGLAAVMDPQRLRSILDKVGTPDGPATTSLVAYRPGRRAVVLVHAGSQTLYIKVLRPERVARVAAAHRRLAAGGVPVAALCGLVAVAHGPARHALDEEDAE